MKCPECGGTSARPIAQGFVECASTVTDLVESWSQVNPSAPPWHPDAQMRRGQTRVVRNCGHRYQHATAQDLPECERHGLFAIGRCGKCSKPICGRDGCATFLPRATCQACVWEAGAADRARTKRQEDADQRLAQQARDRVFARLAAARTKADVAGVLAHPAVPPLPQPPESRLFGERRSSMSDLAGWPDALREAWSRLTSAGVFGRATHDLVQFSVTWECSRKSSLLTLKESGRTPAWFAMGGGLVEIEEGMDSITRKVYRVDLWATSDAEVFTRAHVWRAGSTKKAHDAKLWLKLPSPRLMRSERRTVPAGEMIMVLPPGASPIRRDEKTSGLLRTVGISNGIEVTSKMDLDRRTHGYYDLASAMAALAHGKG